MTGSSVLPVTIYKGKLYFLFGKENELEDSAKGFSDFGGGVEKGEQIRNTALREGGEELTGFLGDHRDIEKHIRTHGGTYRLSFNDYHIHLFYYPYDPNLPKYYNANHSFLWKRMDKYMLNKTKLFEKSKIQWFSTSMMNSRIKDFRSFYQDHVKYLLSQKNKIKQFVQRCMNRHKTKRRANKSRKQSTRKKVP